MDEVPHAGGETVGVVDGVHLTPLAAGERMSVQAFHSEPGAAIPEHAHVNEQAGYVAAGTFTVDVAGDEHVLGPGDSYVVPAEETHGARNDGDEPVRGVHVFSPPRASPDWQA